MDPAEREKVEETIRDNNFQIKFRIHQIEDQLSRSSNDTALSHEVSKLKDQLEFTDVSLQRLKTPGARPLIDAEREYAEAKLRLDDVVSQVANPQFKLPDRPQNTLDRPQNTLDRPQNTLDRPQNALNDRPQTNSRQSHFVNAQESKLNALNDNRAQSRPEKPMDTGVAAFGNKANEKPRFMTFGQFRAFSRNPVSNKENENDFTNKKQPDEIGIANGANGANGAKGPNNNGANENAMANGINGEEKGKRPVSSEFEPANDLISMESFDPVNMTPLRPKPQDPLKQLNGTVEHLTPDSVLAPGQTLKKAPVEGTTAFFDPFSDASDALCQSLVNETKSLKKELDTLKRKMAAEKPQPQETVQSKLKELYNRMDALSIDQVKAQLGELIQSTPPATTQTATTTETANLSADSHIAIYKYGIQRLRTKRNDLLFCNSFKSKELESYRNASRKRLRLLHNLGIIKILDEERAFSTARPRPTLKSAALAIRAAIRIKRRLAASRQSAVALRRFVKSNV